MCANKNKVEQKNATCSEKNKCNKSKKANEKKACKLSRADKRQIELTARVIAEKSLVDEAVDSMDKELAKLSAKNDNPIDRDLLSVRSTILKAYSALLFMTARFEHYRIRREGGEYLNRDPEGLMKYIFGSCHGLETRLGTKCCCSSKPCGGKCCKDKGKNK